MTERLYIYVKDWERFQPRSDRPNLPWLRLYTDLLGNDDWLELTPEDKVLLMTIWMLVQKHGQGRVIGCLSDSQGNPIGAPSYLQRQANLPLSNRYRGLHRLIQAGFITLSTTKAAPGHHQNGGLEEKREEKRREEPPLTPPVEAIATRPRNRMWDALVTVFGYSPTSKAEQSLWGKLVKTLNEMEADEDSLLLAASRYRTAMPNVEMTPTALVKHYQRLITSNGSTHLSEIGAQAKRLGLA